MLIANPLYDVVFKKLMEDRRVAKFFIGTLISEKVVDLRMMPQEFTYEDESKGFTVFRLDFSAVVETAEGKRKKILVEVQKAKNEVDLYRFRNYLGEQYKRKGGEGDQKAALPITTIYILGFDLSNIDTACLRVRRLYCDMIKDRVLDARNDFVEMLTHDSYVVQAKKIAGSGERRLDKLLSVFEQRHFFGDVPTIKDYPHEIDDEEVERMAGILHRSASDPESRQQVEKEAEAWRTIDALFEKKEDGYKEKIKKQEEQLEEKGKKLKEQDRKLEEQDRKMEEQDRKLEEQAGELAALRKRLAGGKEED